MVQKVFIAIPSHSGDVRVGTFMSVLQSVMDAHVLGIDVNVQCWVGDALIPHARNILFAKFLQETDCTDMVMVDSDVSWHSGEFVRLIKHPVDFVAGGYRFKNDNEDYPMQWLPDPEGKGLWADPETGLIEIAGAPTGFLRITRAAAEKMVEAYSSLWYNERLCANLKLHWLFDLQVTDHVLRGEDYAFCKKWREIGGKIWLDPELKLDHTGHKEFKGYLGDWLKHRDRPIEDAAKKLENLRRTFSSPEMTKLFEQALGEAA